MLELLTLYSHADHLTDPAYHVNGMINEIETKKEPEYSKQLRDLIRDCLKPDPSNRIRLEVLRVYLKSRCKSIHKKYKKAIDKEKARFETDALLYYIKDEIINMPTGTWENYDPEPRPEPEKFPDQWPIKYPRFEKGPDGKERRINNNVKIRVRNHPPRRTRAQHHARLRDGGVRKGRLGHGGSPSSGPPLLGNAVARGAAREDGGVEGMVGDLTDGLEDAAEDDGSMDMEFESDNPVSLPPAGPQGQGQAPVQAPVQAQAQAQAPIVQAAPRRLRNGTVFAYF